MSSDAVGVPGPDALAEWLPRQRWFGAKSHRIARVGIADAVRLATGMVLLLDVELEGGGSERYAAPLLAGGEIRDALADVDFCRSLLALIARGDAVAGERGELGGVPGAGLPADWADGPPAHLSGRRLPGEQSNTSVVLGEAVVFKHFRKLAEGVNPEAEITRFLTERTSFSGTPRLAGHLEYRDTRGGTTTTLAVVHILVPHAVDGWQWVLAQQREPGAGGVIIEALRRLGELTGELHRALASDARTPAFAPEPIGAGDVATWTAAVARQVEAARAALRGEAVAVDLEDVRAGLAPLLGRQKIRHHGDLHLGQTLYRPATRDWMIIDFEGEPLRPLGERRRKHAAPRDVAGMLRSINYAAVSARSAGSRLSGAWEVDAARALVEGYGSAAGRATFLPETAAGFRKAVAVFELEKAAYEIVYEANNRPDWVAIPTRGLLNAAARLRGEEAGAG